MSQNSTKSLTPAPSPTHSTASTTISMSPPRLTSIGQSKLARMLLNMRNPTWRRWQKVQQRRTPITKKCIWSVCHKSINIQLIKKLINQSIFQYGSQTHFTICKHCDKLQSFHIKTGILGNLRKHTGKCSKRLEAIASQVKLTTFMKRRVDPKMKTAAQKKLVAEIYLH
jgi:hypothetical protein